MTAAPNYSAIALYPNAPADAPEDDTMERFAELPDAQRADLLHEFLILKADVTGTLQRRTPIFGGTGHVATVRTDLEAAFAGWLRDEGHIQ